MSPQTRLWAGARGSASHSRDFLRGLNLLTQSLPHEKRHSSELQLCLKYSQLFTTVCTLCSGENYPVALFLLWKEGTVCILQQTWCQSFRVLHYDDNRAACVSLNISFSGTIIQSKAIVGRMYVLRVWTHVPSFLKHYPCSHSKVLTFTVIL